MAAELHAELSVLRNELESTPRGGGQARPSCAGHKTVDPAASLVPVRSSTTVTFWQGRRRSRPRLSSQRLSRATQRRAGRLKVNKDQGGSETSWMTS